MANTGSLGLETANRGLENVGDRNLDTPMAKTGLAMNGYPHVVKRGTSCLAAPYRFFASTLAARQRPSLDVTARHHHQLQLTFTTSRRCTKH
jgi:hypothetical protein